MHLRHRGRRDNAHDVSQSQAMDILRGDHENVVLSIGKSGRQIARLAAP
jgi:hypothetical protein